MPNTIYRPVPGYDDLYASLEGDIVKAGYGSLKQKVGSRGYLELNIPKVGMANSHVLVAAAFLGPRPNGIVVRHGDGVKTNNKLENLCYGTPLDNTHDAIRHGTHGSLLHKRKTHCPQGHEFSVNNTYIVPGTDWRQCRICRSEIDARRSLRRKGLAPPLPPRITKAQQVKERAERERQKDEAIHRLLKCSPELSNREIGRRTGVGHPRVGKHRRQLAQTIGKEG